MRRVATAALAAALVLDAGAARAADWPYDDRIPLRLGFGWDGARRAPGVAWLAAIEVDVAKLGRGARLVLGLDFDALQRTDVDTSDPSSMKLRVGGFVGAIVRPTRSWAIVVHEGASMVLMPSPDDPGAMNLVGGGFFTAAYFYPAYVPFDDPDGFGHSMARAVLSGFAIWARGEVDYTDRGRGGELAFGVSMDVVRFLFSPVLSTVSHTPPRSQ